MLELENVEAYYGDSRVLQGVSLSVKDGEFVSILGRNGVGKTTLIRSILGLMDRVEGSIQLDGTDIKRFKTHDRALAGIGYVPQGRGILPKFTVRQNLMLGTFANPKSNRGNGARIAEWVFELFPILREFLDRRGGNLSGGQQQQLAIARTLLSEPKIILLDEPTEGIQPNIVEQIEQVLIDLNRKHGKTIVLIEQNIGFARRASQHFAIMDRGQVAARGPVQELTDQLVHRHLAV
ncbi:ABC transporter ATP-binding protein [Hypericibacter terrae]|uniref:ABC transporter ATP-binding protein n=1 Tax=Hypericibacter terrae TaxID=2602015 RepID=A0A5J6MKJ0_9PROT|nr:urea ABC transporter ATP-binding subunit UrtE [Hypericibacter terrae]QEX18112.1 ABC transporter ATP-binding protein [Hypericibacter terrae]